MPVDMMQYKVIFIANLGNNFVTAVSLITNLSKRLETAK